MKLPIKVSQRAFERLREISAAQPADGAAKLRVAVLGGGCSGFQYDIALVAQADPDDEILTDGACEVLIDPVSRDFLGGAEIDFEDALIGARFVIHNPNAASSCGCGTSFSI